MKRKGIRVHLAWEGFAECVRTEQWLGVNRALRAFVEYRGHGQLNRDEPRSVELPGCTSERRAFIDPQESVGGRPGCDRTEGAEMKSYTTLVATGVLTALLAGCNSEPQSEPTADETSVALNAASTDAVDETISDDGDDDVVEVVEVPSATSTTSVEAAPLVAAAAVSRIIKNGDGIERIRYEDGWAWRQNGKIIRTASKDGRRVSYFQNGDTKPYLVQNNDRTFAYSRGELQHSYNGKGQPIPVDSSRRQEATKLIERSNQDRADAVRTAAQTPDRIQPERQQQSDRQPAVAKSSKQQTAQPSGSRNSENERREGADRTEVTQPRTSKGETDKPSGNSPKAHSTSGSHSSSEPQSSSTSGHASASRREDERRQDSGNPTQP